VIDVGIINDAGATKQRHPISFCKPRAHLIDRPSGGLEGELFEGGRLAQERIVPAIPLM